MDEEKTNPEEKKQDSEGERQDSEGNLPEDLTKIQFRPTFFAKSIKWIPLLDREDLQGAILKDGKEFLAQCGWDNLSKTQALSKLTEIANANTKDRLIRIFMQLLRLVESKTQYVFTKGGGKGLMEFSKPATDAWTILNDLSSEFHVPQWDAVSVDGVLEIRFGPSHEKQALRSVEALANRIEDVKVVFEGAICVDQGVKDEKELIHIRGIVKELNIKENYMIMEGKRGEVKKFERILETFPYLGELRVKTEEGRG